MQKQQLLTLWELKKTDKSLGDLLKTSKINGDGKRFIF